jgi:hypothetical protein
VNLFEVEYWVLIETVILSTGVDYAWLVLELVSYKNVLAKILRQVLGEFNFYSKENFFT